MNFVGHAYIARNNPELIAGNFAGDSYKGNLDKFSYLPEHVLNGVRLHRFIDDFTDTSPIIRSAGKFFQDAGITKVTYIAIDIILDHYLTKNWSLYSSKKFEDFVAIVYKETDKNLPYLEDDFCFMYDKLKDYEWLFQYHTEEGIDMILWQFSRRMGFANDLSRCMPVYQKNKTEIDALFADFMKTIVDKSQVFIHQLLQ